MDVILAQHRCRAARPVPSFVTTPSAPPSGLAVGVDVTFLELHDSTGPPR